jgi:hypothetical protein
MLDDIDITSVQRADQSHGMVIPGMVAAGDSGGRATDGQSGVIASD